MLTQELATGPRNLPVKHTLLMVWMQEDLGLHGKMLLREGTKVTGLEWKVSSESGKGRGGSTEEGWNNRTGPDKLDTRLLYTFLGCSSEVGAVSGVDT